MRVWSKEVEHPLPTYCCRYADGYVEHHQHLRGSSQYAHLNRRFTSTRLHGVTQERPKLSYHGRAKSDSLCEFGKFKLC
jgi:hypothetical protein